MWALANPEGEAAIAAAMVAAGGVPIVVRISQDGARIEK